MAFKRAYEDSFPQPQLNSSLTKCRFLNKLAIVTGGASGIGRATVERFSNDGAFVAIFDLDEDLGRGLEENLLSKGRKAKFYKVDVSNRDLCVEIVKAVADENGGMVNYLTNCAVSTLGRKTAVTDLTPEDWQRSLAVNVVGASNMLQACYPYMKKDGSNCAVVNVTSVRAHCAVRNAAMYSAGKGALTCLTKCMAVDLSTDGIRVNSVIPGAVWTPIQFGGEKAVPREDLEAYWSRMHISPRCFIEAAGVASAITFLCCEDAMYINGADIPVDAGHLAMGPEGTGQ